MANLSTSYQQDGSSSGAAAAAVLLLLEPGDVGANPAVAAAANGDVSAAGEPPSSSSTSSPGVHLGGDGSVGASRFHHHQHHQQQQQHLPPASNHLGPHHHLHHHQASPGPPKDHPLSHHHHFQPGQQLAYLSGENTAESPGRKAQVPAAEDSCAVARGSGHAYAAVGVVPNNNTTTTPSEAVDDIRKCGYLRKQKHGHKRFFVLRAASERGPARLEYYENEKKFRSKSPVPKKTLNLETCFNVNKRADSKNKHMIVLYTRSESFAVAADTEEIQDAWYQAMLDLQYTCKTRTRLWLCGVVWR